MQLFVRVVLLAPLAVGCGRRAGNDSTFTENVPPSASAGDDLTARPGVMLSFDGSSSSDSDGELVEYAWDFGDGSDAATGATIEHAFAAPGTFSVTLTVTDNDDATDSDSVTVLIDADNPLPEFTFDPTTGVKAGETV